MSERIAESLLGSPAIRAAREAARGFEAWVVGGAVRDAISGRAVGDVDLAVAPGQERELARRLSAERGAACFELSSEFGTWRAVAADRSWHVDLTRLRGPSIEDDLALRDFTVNALALPLADLASEPLDLAGGAADAEARILRAVSAASFADDPLRIMRAARQAAELGFEIESGTLQLAQVEAGRAGEPAGERQLAELRMLLAGPDPIRGLRLLDELGATAGVLPELEALRGVRQNPNHHLDVHGHTIEVLEHWLEIERDLETYAGESAAGVAELLAEPLADGWTRRDAIRLGAITHDVGKPATRIETADWVTFIGHDSEGAKILAVALDRLKASRVLSRYVQALAMHHLRLGFLVPERPLPRARLYDYLSATAPVAADVTLLTIADRLAARGSGPTASDEMINGHLALAKEVLPAALDWHRGGPPEVPIRGDELASELGIELGPQLGRLIERVRAGVFEGVVRSPGDAVELARARSTSSANRLAPMPTDPDCIFCKIVAGELPGEIIDSDERTVSFMDINPATTGHALVIPREHAQDLMDISDQDLEAVTLAARRLAAKMEQKLRPDGFNLINACRAPAWQTVFHFHMHVVPRYLDDPLQLPWIPGPGDPETIAATAAQIRGD